MKENEIRRKRGGVKMEGIIIPTVVIGIGEAGTKMAAALHKLVKEESVGEYFKFVVMDSNEVDLNRNTPAEIKERIILNTPPVARVKEDKEKHGYLYEGVDITGVGAARQRVVGRYLIDNEWNYDGVYRTLSRTIRDFGEKYKSFFATQPTSSLNIWLLHSLGGGTGSGTFTLLIAFIQEMRGIIKDDLGVNSFFGGIGCLSSMPEDIRRGPISGQPIYYANSLAALMELKKMKELKESEELKIPLYTKGGEAIKIKGIPFNKYFLVGINEEEAERIKPEWTESHIEQKNNVVANCIYTLSKHVGGLENWPDPTNPSEYIIGSFGEHELCVPMDVVISYVELKEELKELKKSLGEIENDMKEKGERLKTLNDISLNPKEIEKGKAEDIEKRVNGELADKDLARVPEEDIVKLFDDVKRVQDLEGARFVVEVLDEKIKKAPHESKWKEAVTKLWGKHAKKNEFPNIASIEEKHKKLLEWLKQATDSDKSWLASPPSLRYPWDTKNKREERLKELRKEERKLEDTKEDYAKIIKLEGKIATLRGKIEKDVEDELKGIKEEIKDLKTKKEEKEKEKTTKEGDISGREEDLGKSKFGRMGYLEIKDNLDKLTKTEIERLKTIKDFVGEGFVKEADVERGLKTQIGNAERLSNIAPKKRARLDLLFMRNDENKELIELLPSTATANFAASKEYSVDDGYGIKMCVYRNGIGIEDIREYEKLKKLYDKGELSKILGIEVGKAFAYPEWFMDDDNVKAVFKKIIQ